MSHFTVAIFSKEGQTIESLLEPFDEKKEVEEYEDGDIYSTYNPLSQWDWYQVGGRWNNLLRLKSGERANSAKIKDIDFSLDELEYQKSIRYWELIVEGSQPQNLEEEAIINYNLNVPEYYLRAYNNKEQYATECAEIRTYAVITPDGEWHAKGKMGWFGCDSENGENVKNWNSSFKETFVDTADPEWTLTIVDCHI